MDNISVNPAGFSGVGVGPNVWFKAQKNGNDLVLTREDGKPNIVQWVHEKDPSIVYMTWEITRLYYEERSGSKYLIMNHKATCRSHVSPGGGINVDFEFFGEDKNARLWKESWPDVYFDETYATHPCVEIIARTDFTLFTKNLHFSAGGGWWGD